MIIGSGLIAKALINIDNDSVVFIASGVSNSKSINILEFQREVELVKATISKYNDKLIVFFSTYSIFDKSVYDNPYVQHKLNLELIVQSISNFSLIVRPSNIVGLGGNPNTIFNFLYYSIINGTSFQLWQNSFRNLLMVDDFIEILGYIINTELNSRSSKVVNIINDTNYSIIEIVNEIENYTGKRAFYSVLDSSDIFNSQPLDLEAVNRIRILGINTNSYLNSILKNIINRYYLI